MITDAFLSFFLACLWPVFIVFIVFILQGGVRELPQAPRVIFDRAAKESPRPLEVVQP